MRGSLSRKSITALCVEVYVVSAFIHTVYFVHFYAQCMVCIFPFKAYAFSYFQAHSIFSFLSISYPGYILDILMHSVWFVYISIIILKLRTFCLFSTTLHCINEATLR